MAVLFVWSKNIQDKLGYDAETQPVLEAYQVMLEVLAPSEYYDNYDLSNLSSALNSGIYKFGQQHSLALGFGFSQLGSDYAPDLQPGHVRTAISYRSPIWIPE